MSVADLYVYTNTVLDLATNNLYVFTHQHALGGGTTNTIGGQIIWINVSGTVFNLY